MPKQSKLTQVQKDYVIANYHEMGPTRISRALNVTEATVTSWGARRGLRVKSYVPLTPEQIEFIKTHYPSRGEAFCATELKRSRYVVKVTVAKLKIPKRIRAIAQEKMVDISRFLDIKEPEVAYFLGFMWADGHVHKNTNGIHLDIQKRDYLSLKSLFEQIGQFHHYTKTDCNRGGDQGGIRLDHHPLRTFLAEHDYLIKSVASPDKIVSKIPDHLKHYFWRGLCDGDGCIGVDLRGRYLVYIAGSYEQDWNAAQSLMDGMMIKYVVFQASRINRTSGKLNSSSGIKITNKIGFLTFCDYIYQGYETDGIGLKRKWEKFQEGIAMSIRHDANLKARSKRLAVFTEDWTPIREYESLEAAARDLGTTSKDIREYFRCKRKHHRHMQFKILGYNVPTGKETRLPLSS